MARNKKPRKHPAKDLRVTKKMNENEPGCPLPSPKKPRKKEKQ